MNNKTIKNLNKTNTENKVIFVRVDYNVPIINNKIIDTTRIDLSLPTIKYLTKLNCKIVILSHLGRVKKQEDLNKYSLKIVCNYLSKKLNKEVKFFSEISGEQYNIDIKNLKNNEIALLENTRFLDLNNKRESNCCEELSKKWADLADYFVFDAFGISHRKHASTYGICQNCKSMYGFLMEKELKELQNIFKNIKQLNLIMGGSKVSDKVVILNNLIDKIDKLYIGGAMAFTFLKAKGLNIGKSLYEKDKVDYAKKILNKYKNKIFLPTDVLVVKDINDPNTKAIKNINNILDDDIGVDIGEKTIQEYVNNLKKASLIVWNGPMGMYEIKDYANGSKNLCYSLSQMKSNRIIGGGDSVAVCTEMNLNDKFNHISTGGGAFLKALEGQRLPIVSIIEDSNIF